MAAAQGVPAPLEDARHVPERARFTVSTAAAALEVVELDEDEVVLEVVELDEVDVGLVLDDEDVLLELEEMDALNEDDDEG